MKKNYYSATATAAKITKVPVEVIRDPQLHPNHRPQVLHSNRREQPLLP